MIPISSKYDKYERIYQSQVNRYGKCDKIVLGKFAGKTMHF